MIQHEEREATKINTECNAIMGWEFERDIDGKDWISFDIALVNTTIYNVIPMQVVVVRAFNSYNPEPTRITVAAVDNC